MQSQVVRSLLALGIALGWSGDGQAQQGPLRQLAPGVLTVIPTEEQPEETVSGPRPIVEIAEGLKELAWDPHFDAKSSTLHEKSKKVVLRRVIWNLEFAFKPIRMIEVDVPQPSKKMQRKLIWYMVYRVTNRGHALRPKPVQDRWGHTTYEMEHVNYSKRRFFPRFILTSHEYPKEYLDRVIPAAKDPIQARERPGAKLHDTVEISTEPILLSDDRTEKSVWGVVTWEDIDPKIDFFSVFVDGLSNAYQFTDPEGAYQAGDAPGTGRAYRSKYLQLNFWRPGDNVLEHEREIRFGMPNDSNLAIQQQIFEKYGLRRRLDYLWVYR